MNFLRSLRSDLLSRPVLPLLILVCVGLVGAVVYVAGSGGSSSSTGESSVPPIHSTTNPSNNGLSAASEVTAGPTVAVSETTSGARYQNQGKAHNPFKELPSAAPKATTGTSTTSSSSSGSSGSKSTSPTGAGGTTPSSSTPKPPAKHKTAKPVYVVSLLAGFAPSAGQPVNLTAFPEVKVGDKLPSKTDPRLIFERVNSAGTAAIFKPLVPPILHGSARCLPSPENCEEIEIPAKQAEQFEYTEANGQTTLYEIGVVSITKVSAKGSAARAHAASNNAGHHKHHRRRHRSK